METVHPISPHNLDLDTRPSLDDLPELVLWRRSGEGCCFGKNNTTRHQPLNHQLGKHALGRFCCPMVVRMAGHPAGIGARRERIGCVSTRKGFIVMPDADYDRYCLLQTDGTWYDSWLVSLGKCAYLRSAIQDNLYTLVTEQLDPIVSPNRQSSHMHRILGA